MNFEAGEEGTMRKDAKEEGRNTAPVSRAMPGGQDKR